MRVRSIGAFELRAAASEDATKRATILNRELRVAAIGGPSIRPEVQVRRIPARAAAIWFASVHPTRTERPANGATGIAIPAIGGETIRVIRDVHAIALQHAHHLGLPLLVAVAKAGDDDGELAVCQRLRQRPLDVAANRVQPHALSGKECDVVEGPNRLSVGKRIE